MKMKRKKGSFTTPLTEINKSVWGSSSSQTADTLLASPGSEPKKKKTERLAVLCLQLNMSLIIDYLHVVNQSCVDVRCNRTLPFRLANIM